jgi:AcrR family transcriptional regulator
VATLNVIRRWALRDQMSIREISRRTGLARNTVKKHLRSEESEPKYPRRVISSKLDPYVEKLATWLGIEATKSRKQRRTLRQIHTDSASKGENQELIHIVSTFCSQRVWVNVRWKTRVRLQRNSTISPAFAACMLISLSANDLIMSMAKGKQKEKEKEVEPEIKGGHRTGARPSTEDAHQKGDSRRKANQERKKRMGFKY